MNIGILIPGFGANDDDWALPVYQNLVRELAKTHDVRVIALRYPHTTKAYTYHNAQVFPLGYGAWTRGIRRFSLWWATWQMVKQLHAEKPFDVLHGIWADETGALSGWIGKRLHIPSVVTVAGGELVGLSDINYGLQISAYGRWIVQQALQSNTATIVPYQYLLPHHFKAIGYTPSNVHFIPLGVDTKIFFPGNINRIPKRLIHVGSLIPVKNQKILLDTMTLLEDDVTLDIIGEGYLELELKAYASKKDISHRVNFLGKIQHTDLCDHYSQAQLHILVSHHEAFGMAVLEAAACGVPTIGTHVGLISDEPNFTITADNPKELANTIQSLLASPSTLQSLQAKCVSTVQQNYTIEHIASQHIKLYHWLCEQ